MINIESLPKIIKYSGIPYGLRLHVTAWGKLCVCYKRWFPDEKEGIPDHLFSQVVEPDMNESPKYVEDPTAIMDVPTAVMDVPTLELAWHVLSVRVKNALEAGEIQLQED